MHLIYFLTKYLWEDVHYRMNKKVSLLMQRNITEIRDHWVVKSMKRGWQEELNGYDARSDE